MAATNPSRGFSRPVSIQRTKCHCAVHGKASRNKASSQYGIVVDNCLQTGDLRSRKCILALASMNPDPDRALAHKPQKSRCFKPTKIPTTTSQILYNPALASGRSQTPAIVPIGSTASFSPEMPWDVGLSATPVRGSPLRSAACPALMSTVGESGRNGLREFISVRKDVSVVLKSKSQD